MKNLDPPYRLDQRAHTASSWYEEPSLCRCRIFPKRRECGKGRRQAIESFSFNQLGPTYYHVYDGLSKKVYMTMSTRVNTLGAKTTCYLLFWSNHRKRTWDSMWYSLQRLRERLREKEKTRNQIPTGGLITVWVTVIHPFLLHLSFLLSVEMGIFTKSLLYGRNPKQCTA